MLIFLKRLKYRLHTKRKYGTNPTQTVINFHNNILKLRFQERVIDELSQELR